MEAENITAPSTHSIKSALIFCSLKQANDRLLTIRHQFSLKERCLASHPPDEGTEWVHRRGFADSCELLSFLSSFLLLLKIPMHVTMNTSWWWAVGTEAGQREPKVVAKGNSMYSALGIWLAAWAGSALSPQDFLPSCVMITRGELRTHISIGTAHIPQKAKKQSYLCFLCWFSSVIFYIEKSACGDWKFCFTHLTIYHISAPSSVPQACSRNHLDSPSQGCAIQIFSKKYVEQQPHLVLT